ncbi:MAG: hypothetical protein P1Q69_17660 [Candidatus Thorarchaeota archaeon]|nr:hypothetical protein [Candidatus Thorarchaeota archaeon]
MIVQGPNEMISETGTFVKLDLFYWYIENINDLWGFKKLMDPLFHNVFYRAQDYDSEGAGWKVLVEHLKMVTKGWRTIKRTLLVGYMYYLNLFQETTIIPLETINRGLKDKSLKGVGLTEANAGSFGKTTHYEILGTCWNCGDEIEDERSGLCMDCLDYWDRKTR